MSERFIVSQLGARRDYAVPRALYAVGMLEHLYTDISAVGAVRRLLDGLPIALRTGAVKRLRGRVPSLPESLVTHFPWLGLEAVRRRSKVRTYREQTEIDLWAAKKFSKLVNRRGFGRATAIYGLSGECLEQLVAARQASMRTVVEQMIAPRTVLDALMEEEEVRFPGWQPPGDVDAFADEYAARERAEWTAADIILCGSEFVKQGVVACGGEASKCIVVPYGIDSRYAGFPRRRRPGPLRVLTVGGVGLRKGSQYLSEVAARLKGQAVCRLVGPVQALPQALGHLAETLELLPPVPRAHIERQYAWADVFLLPSICEGSAAVIYEAMAAGLPVVTTPNAGSVVRNGVDGFVIPIRDVNAIVDRIERLAADPDLYASMSAQACTRAAEYTLDAYARGLVAALTKPGSVVTAPAREVA